MLDALMVVLVESVVSSSVVLLFVSRRPSGAKR